MELTEVKTLVGQNIRKLRKAKDFTQENLAHKTDLGESYMSEIENGKVNPTLETLNKIA